MEDYYTADELAARYHVSSRAVRKWIDEGAFPNAYRVGPGRRSPIRIPVSDVVEFERKRKVRHDDSK